MKIVNDMIIGERYTAKILYIMDRDRHWTGDSVRYPWCYYIPKKDKRKLLSEKGYNPHDYYLEEAGAEITKTIIPLKEAIKLGTQTVETIIYGEKGGIVRW